MPNFFFLIINEITADKKIAKPRTFLQIDFCNGLSFITFTAFAKCCVISMKHRFKKVQDFLFHHPYCTVFIMCVLSLFPVLFGFLGSFVCGVLNFGEAMTFMLLWNFARYIGWLGSDVTFAKGVVYSQVARICESHFGLFAEF